MGLLDNLFSRKNDAKPTGVDSSKAPTQEERFQTARNYMNGDGGLPHDEERGASMYLQLAKEGYAPAFLRLARCYLNGWGVSPDPAQGKVWLEKAAAQNDAEAMVDLGEILDEEKELFPENHERALSLFRKAADLGHDIGQYYVGLMYLRGDTVEESDEIAHSWFLKASEGGSVDAQFLTAVDYDTGEGTEENKEKALYWHTKAAEGGHERSQVWLALEYYGGELVEHDWNKAFYWCEKAAECAGDGQAMKLLGKFYETGVGVAIDKKKAREWYLKAIEAGEEEAKDWLQAMETMVN